MSKPRRRYVGYVLNSRRRLPPPHLPSHTHQQPRLLTNDERRDSPKTATAGERLPARSCLNAPPSASHLPPHSAYTRLDQTARCVFGPDEPDTAGAGATGARRSINSRQRRGGASEALH